jgi:hypothetical protein
VKKVMLCVMYLLTLVAVAQPMQPPKMPVFPNTTWPTFEDFLEKQSGVAWNTSLEYRFTIQFYIDEDGSVKYPTVLYNTHEAIAQQLYTTIPTSPKWSREGMSPDLITKVEKKLTFKAGKWEVKTKMMSYRLASIGRSELQSQSKVVFMPQYEAPKTDVKQDDDIYNVSGIEAKPEYPGGPNEFYKLIAKHYRTPDVPGLNGTVIVSFVIEKDGTLTELKVLRDIGYGTGEEAIRVLKLSPLWQPATQRGVPVRCRYSIPIKIKNN